MAKKEITDEMFRKMTDELQKILPYESAILTQRHGYQKFKEKATSSEISSFITSLEKFMKNGKMNSKVFAAFKKDLEKTRELKRQDSAERQKQLEKDQKDDIDRQKWQDTHNPFSRMKSYLRAVISGNKEFSTTEFTHLRIKCMEKLMTDKKNFSDNYKLWVRNPSHGYGESIFEILQDSTFRRLASKHDCLKNTTLDYYFNANFDIHKGENTEEYNNKHWTFSESSTFMTKRRKKNIKDGIKNDKKKYTYSSSKKLPKRTDEDEDYVDDFTKIDNITNFVEAVQEYNTQKTPKKAARNKIKAEPEIENEEPTPVKKTKIVENHQEDKIEPNKTEVIENQTSNASELNKTEVEEFILDIVFNDDELEHVTYSDEELAQIDANEARIKELDAQINAKIHREWDRKTIDEYLRLTNVYKNIELIKDLPDLNKNFTFLVECFKPEFVALWPEKFSHPMILEAFAQKGNLDEVQKLLFLFAENPTVFNKNDQTAPKSADKLLSILNIYMQRVADCKEKDAGNFKNLKHLYAKLFPEGKAICPQLEKYQDFLESLLKKDINYEDHKGWKKSLPSKWMNRLDSNAKDARSLTLANQQMEKDLEQIITLGENEKLYWSQEKIQNFIENDRARRVNGVSMFSLDVERLFAALAPSVVNQLSVEFKASVFNPEFLENPTTKKVFDDQVVKRFAEKGDMHEVKRMLFQFARNRETMQPDLFMHCLAKFTDRLMTTKNPVERATFFSMRGLYDKLYEGVTDKNDPLMLHKKAIADILEVNEEKYAKGYKAWKNSRPKNCAITLETEAELARANRVYEEIEENHIMSDPDLRERRFHKETLRKLGQIVPDSQFDKMKTSELRDWVNSIYRRSDKTNSNEFEGDELY